MTTASFCLHQHLPSEMMGIARKSGLSLGENCFSHLSRYPEDERIRTIWINFKPCVVESHNMAEVEILFLDQNGQRVFSAHDYFDKGIWRSSNQIGEQGMRAVDNQALVDRWISKMEDQKLKQISLKSKDQLCQLSRQLMRTYTLEAMDRIHRRIEKILQHVREAKKPVRKLEPRPSFCQRVGFLFSNFRSLWT